jgi:hypothetical protein
MFAPGGAIFDKIAKMPPFNASNRLYRLNSANCSNSQEDENGGIDQKDCVRFELHHWQNPAGIPWNMHAPIEGS